MGRISDTSLYPFDTAITPNDYIIGTDGDNLNATKNYKVATMLGYLGNMFNLQSQDLYYTYNAVASTSVGVGEISSNNYQDGTILTSGVTNLYVSKLTALGALVDTYLNAIATDNLTLIVMDLSAPQNYLVFNLTGSSDVDANTIDLAGTVGESNGELVSGRSIGFKLTAGGGVAGNFVTLDTTQTITASKTFSGIVNFTGFLTSVTNLSSTTATSNLLIMNRQGASIPDSVGSNTGFALVGDFLGQPHYFLGKILSTGSTGTTFSNIDGGFLDFSALTEQRKYKFPNATGTFPLLESNNVFTATSNTFQGELNADDVIKMKSATTVSTGGSGSSIFRYTGSSTYGFAKDNSFTEGQLNFGNLTAVRTYTWPDVTGSVVLTEGVQSINGQKTFNDNFLVNEAASNFFSAPYQAGFVASGFRLIDTTIASPNNGYFQIKNTGGGVYGLYSPTGVASSSGVKLILTNNDTQVNNQLTAVDIQGQLQVDADPYDATDWAGNTQVPTKDAIRDKFESLPASEEVVLEGSLVNLDFTSGDVNTTIISAQGAGTIVEITELTFFVDNFTSTGIINLNVEFATTGNFISGTTIANSALTNAYGYHQRQPTAAIRNADERNQAVRIRMTNTVSETTTGTIYYRIKYKVWTPV